MKYTIILMLCCTFAFSQNTYGYGKIDMHGGKTDALSKKEDKSMKDFSNKNTGMSNFLKNNNNKKREFKKTDEKTK